MLIDFLQFCLASHNFRIVLGLYITFPKSSNDLINQKFFKTLIMHGKLIFSCMLNKTVKNRLASHLDPRKYKFFVHNNCFKKFLIN